MTVAPADMILLDRRAYCLVFRIGKDKNLKGKAEMTGISSSTVRKVAGVLAGIGLSAAMTGAALAQTTLERIKQRGSLICGASHVPFGRQVGDVKIVNVGSVGESPAAGFAHATILDASAAGVSIEQFDVEL